MADPSSKGYYPFPSTQWPLIQRRALDELVRLYRPALKAYLIFRKRIASDIADDLVQGFITDKILDRDLLGHADPARGKFRTLLVKSLENYVTDEYRANRWPRQDAIRMEQSSDLGFEPAAPYSPQDFDALWARDLLEEVLQEMWRDCEASGQESIWRVFESRLLGPTLAGVEPPNYQEIATRFGFATADQAANALVTAKRKFKRAFEQIAARYCWENQQTDDVLAELIEVLAKVGPLNWEATDSSWQAATSGDRASSRLDSSHPEQLLRILKLDVSPNSVWEEADLANMLQQRLAQRLNTLVAEHQTASWETIPSNQTRQTLSELLQHPTPSLELLSIVKSDFKSQAVQGGFGVSNNVALAIYFACVAAALVRWDQRITKSDDDVLRLGLKQMHDLPWLNVALRQLYQQALERLGNTSEAQ